MADEQKRRSEGKFFLDRGVLEVYNAAFTFVILRVIIFHLICTFPEPLVRMLISIFTYCVKYSHNSPTKRLKIAI